MHIERFAPSPTGLLHLGHAFSALTAYEAAMAAGGRFLLRIEDIDRARCRPEFEAAMMEDLRWLGIHWEEPVMRQSERMEAYADALLQLDALGLTYRCTCTRRDILDAVDAPQEGGPDGMIYPGLCKGVDTNPGTPAAIRLDMEKAANLIESLSFTELGAGPDGETGHINVNTAALTTKCGDIVLARKEFPTSYHLAVVVDDAAQGVAHVTRGQDLFTATPVHRLLQTLLGLPEPAYRHHRLIRDETGKRLAKRHDSKAIAKYRAEGWSPEDVIAFLRLGQIDRHDASGGDI